MNDQLPKSIWTGTFHVFGVDVVCHVLDDGSRVVETESVERLLSASDNPVLFDNSESDFAAWLSGSR